MKAIIAIFVILVSVFVSVPVFAGGDGDKEAVHPWSPFNIVGGWVNNAGERKDGTHVWKFEKKESTKTAAEIREQRRNAGR